MTEFYYQLSSISSFAEFIQFGGLALIFLVIFFETAVFFGVLVPGGDALLITVGLLCSNKTLPFELPLVVLTIILAAVAGDISGYYFGRKIGKKMLHKKSRWFLKRRHVEKAHTFYRKNSSITYIIGRFLPVIRTFNPMLSGTSGIHFGRFLAYSSISAIIWVITLVLSSFYVGKLYPHLTSYLHFLIPAILLLPFLPLLWKMSKPKVNSFFKGIIVKFFFDKTVNT